MNSARIKSLERQVKILSRRGVDSAVAASTPSATLTSTTVPTGSFLLWAGDLVLTGEETLTVEGTGLVRCV